MVGVTQTSGRRHRVAVASLDAVGDESGPELWRRACAHSKTLPGSAALDVEACVQDYASLPGYAAADLSRCALRREARDEDGSTIRACVGEETRDMLAKGDRSDAIVTMHAEAIERHRVDHGHLPASLRELDASLSGRDAWERPGEPCWEAAAGGSSEAPG